MNSCYKCEFENNGYCKRYPPKDGEFSFMSLRDYSNGCGEWKLKSFAKEELYNKFVKEHKDE